MGAKRFHNDAQKNESQLVPNLGVDNDWEGVEYSKISVNLGGADRLKWMENINMLRYLSLLGVQKHFVLRCHLNIMDRLP